jgi:hypothetical protein
VDQPWPLLGYARTERSRISRWREQGEDNASSPCKSQGGAGLARYVSGAVAMAEKVTHLLFVSPSGFCGVVVWLVHIISLLSVY